MKDESSRAWQPLTFGGVARFAHDWIGRLFLIGFVVILVATIAVIQTARRTWLPVIEAAITKLPGGQIDGGKFTGSETALLAENSFLAIRLDPPGTLLNQSPADLELTFEPNHLRARSVFGSALIKYEPQWNLQLSRTDMEPWWGAWKPAVFGYLAAGTMGFVIASWIALGIPYAIISFILGLSLRRQFTPWGAYKLSIAALMPGAFFFSIGLFIYGLSQIRLAELLAIWIAHFVIGWIFLIGATYALPKRTIAGNPFDEKPEEADEDDAPTQPKNPFTSGS